MTANDVGYTDYCRKMAELDNDGLTVTDIVTVHLLGPVPPMRVWAKRYQKEFLSGDKST